MARVRFLDQVPVGFYEVGNTGGGGGGGTPGGSPDSIQYNAGNNAFGGSNNLIWDPNSNILTVVGTITATSFTGSLLGTASYATNVKAAGGQGEIQFNQNGVLGSNPIFYFDNSLLSSPVLRFQGSIVSGLYTGTGLSNIYAHAEGTNTLADGDYSHAEGDATIAHGYGTHAEGFSTTANGYYSHTEGSGTITGIGAFYSHAEGQNTVTSGSYSHAEGQSTVARGNGSHAEGYGTVANGAYQHVQGTFNISSSDEGAFILGNGTDNSNRSNLIFASGSLIQVTGSVIATQGFTGSLFGTSSWATSATKIQSGSITASINPSSGTFNIRSGSTNLLYVSSSNGNVGISGSVAAPAGTITTLTSTTTNIDGLLSFDRMTSLKAYISIPASTSTNIIQYSSLDYFGIVIEGVALNVSTNESLIFRYTLANNQTKIGSPDTVVLSSTDENYALEFYTKVTFKAGIDTISNIVNVIIGNSYSNNLNIRPMYRLVKAATG